MTKLLEVISVTDSEVSTIRGGWVVSPSAFSTAEMEICWMSFHVFYVNSKVFEIPYLA